MRFVLVGTFFRAYQVAAIRNLDCDECVLVVFTADEHAGNVVLCPLSSKSFISVIHFLITSDNVQPSSTFSTETTWD